MSGAGTPERARLFVALDLPDGVRTRLADWQRAELGTRGALRIVGAEALHVTLCFLGSRPANEAPAIGRAMRSAVPAGVSPGLSLGGAVWLPRRAPHVLAVRLDDEAGRCAALQARVAEVLAAGGFHERETRPFLAHVTVARVRRGRARDVPGDRLAPPPPLRFAARAITLYRSRPAAGGASYEPILRHPFGDP